MAQAPAIQAENPTRTRSQADVRLRMWAGLALVVFSAALLFAPMMNHWRAMSDYEVHNGVLAQQFLDEPAAFFAATPHFLYHVLVGLTKLILPVGDVFWAGAAVMTASYMVLGALVYYWLLRTVEARGWSWIAGGALLTLALLLVTPITFFTPDNMYLGYFTSHVYHNPTIQLMKPFAVGLFFAVLPVYRAEGGVSWRWIPPYALLTAACLLAKPSFILAFVPALGVITLVRMILRQPIRWPVLIGGIVLPSLAILVYQTLTWTNGGGIDIAFLRVFHEWTLHYEPNADQFLVEKLLLSAAFPLLVYSLYWQRASRDLLFNLGWLIFVIAVVYAYFLVDLTVIAAGDFAWSAQIGVFVLFIAAARFLLRVLATTAFNWREMLRPTLALLVLSFHVIAGINWYVLHLYGEAIALLYGPW